MTRERSLSQLMKNSVMTKMGVIALLAGILLLPTSMVTDIIDERQSLNRETIEEVSREWASEQLVTGPILTLPIGRGDTSSTVHQILPEDLKVNGTIRPVKLHRGIYDVVVYSTDLSITGSFRPERSMSSRDTSLARWDRAYLTLGITDLRGIEEDIAITWNDSTVEFEPGSRLSGFINSGVTIDVSEEERNSGEPIPFSIALKLQGSRQISFLPVGRKTEINLTAPWNSPSFTGAFLPDSRSVNDSGFTATWKILEVNRNFASSWTGSTPSAAIVESEFGVALITEVNEYQKSMRSIKYAILTIALTFLVFFLVEVTSGRMIHPFQYVLVGLALSLFYLLLVALSEHIGFNPAYLTAALGITLMITLYSIPAFRSTKLTLLLTLTMLLTYSFLFVLLQLTGYTLLIGALGLALLLGGAMYFTRNIDWYRFTAKGESEGEEKSGETELEPDGEALP